MKKLYFFALMVFIYVNAGAQVLAWDFNGKAGDETGVFSTTTNEGLQISEISRGNVTSTSLANSFNAKSWSTSVAINAAINTGNYYEFTIKIRPGYKFSLASLTASFRRSANGPRNFQWRYSLDAINFFDFGPKLIYTGTATNGAAQMPIMVSSISNLQNVPSGTAITLRLYGYGALAPDGNFAFGRLPGDDISINGTLTALILPLKLLSFNLVNNRDVTNLHWQIACTSSSAQFTIERSADANHFSPLHSQTETQARCAQPFDYTDNHTPAGRSFYRLKMTDVDGSATYSNIIMVLNSKATMPLQVYPTLVTGHTTLTIQSADRANGLVIVFDAAGKRLKQVNISLARGSNSIGLETGELVPGIYHLQVYLDGVPGGTATIVKQ